MFPTRRQPSFAVARIEDGRKEACLSPLSFLFGEKAYTDTKKRDADVVTFGGEGRGQRRRGLLVSAPLLSLLLWHILLHCGYPWEICCVWE